MSYVLAKEDLDVYIQIGFWTCTVNTYELLYIYIYIPIDMGSPWVAHPMRLERVACSGFVAGLDFEIVWTYIYYITDV